MTFKAFEEDSEALREEAGGERIPILFLKKGVTVVRVLPPYSEKRVWIRSLEEHIFKAGDKWRNETCPRAFGLPCPLCEKGEELFLKAKSMNVEENDELYQAAIQYRPKFNFLANVFCLSGPDAENSGVDKGIMVMKFGNSIKKQLMDLNQDVGGWEKITDLDNGVDLAITREGEGLKTRYSVKPRPNRSNIAKVLESHGSNLDKHTLHNLDEMFPPKSYDELVNLLNAQAVVPGFRPSPVPVPARETMGVEDLTSLLKGTNVSDILEVLSKTQGVKVEEFPTLEKEE